LVLLAVLGLWIIQARPLGHSIRDGQLNFQGK
jgi:hypothetical protein